MILCEHNKFKNENHKSARSNFMDVKYRKRTIAIMQGAIDK